MFWGNFNFNNFNVLFTCSSFLSHSALCNKWGILAAWEVSYDLAQPKNKNHLLPFWVAESHHFFEENRAFLHGYTQQSMIKTGQPALGPGQHLVRASPQVLKFAHKIPTIRAIWPEAKNILQLYQWKTPSEKKTLSKIKKKHVKMIKVLLHASTDISKYLI